MAYRSRNSDDHFLYQNMVQLVYICTCTTVRCCKPFQSIQICVDKLHRILHPMNDEEVTYMYTYKCDSRCRLPGLSDILTSIAQRVYYFSTWHVILTHYTDFCFRILVFVVGNSNTLQLLKLWFEQATIIEAMVSQD